MSEIAVISLNDNKIQKMAEEGHKKAKQILRLTENSSNFLSTIQIGVTLAGFLTSASASQTFADKLATAIAQPKVVAVIPYSVISGFAMVVITLIMSYFSLVLGELVPKKIAMQKPEKVSFLAVGPLLFVAKITKPVVKFLSFSTNLVVRLFGFDPNADEEDVTAEEIRMMVDVGEEKGVIENTQKEMINNIFEFDDMDVGDIMTHRTEMFAVEVDDPLEDVVKFRWKKATPVSPYTTMIRTISLASPMSKICSSMWAAAFPRIEPCAISCARRITFRKPSTATSSSRR